MRVIENLKPSLDELYHHGVLGMKWGVRKEDQYDERGGRIKAGTKFSRYSRVENEDNRAGMYVYKDGSLEKEFEDAYIGRTILPYVMGKRKEIYKYDMTTKVDLITPDKKERGKAFVDAFIKNKENWQVLTKGFGTSEENLLYFERLRQKSKNETMLFGTPSNNGYSGAMYSRFTSMFNADQKIRDIYISTLKQKGYNALIDDNDTAVQRVYQSKGVLARLDAAKSKTHKELEAVAKEYSDKTKEFGMFDIKNRMRLYKEFAPSLNKLKADEKKLVKEMARKDIEQDFDGGSFIIFDRNDVNMSIQKVEKKS